MAESKKKILIVDDDPDISRLLQFALISEGFDVSVAASGLAGIEVALRERPDLAVVDVMLPEVDGFEIVRRLRATPTLAHIPIIMLTARGDVNDKLRGFEVGADDYVVKPVVIEELLARIKVLLSRASALAAPRALRPEVEGRVWTLFSLKGGVGTSSLAVNLAIALRQGWADSVVVADIRLDNGTIESMLNLRPSSKVASSQRLGPSDWDEGFIQQLLISHQSKIEVLTPPSSPLGSRIIEADSVRRILTLLPELFQYVVVDTSSTLNGLNWSVFDLSDLIIMVLTADINSWKAAIRTLEMFKTLNIPQHKVVLVYNHVSPISALSPRQAESYLHLPLVGDIPHGGAAFLSSVNVGVPLLLSHPEHPTATAIKELARKLVTRQPEMKGARR